MIQQAFPVSSTLDQLLEQETLQNTLRIAMLRLMALMLPLTAMTRDDIID